MKTKFLIIAVVFSFLCSCEKRIVTNNVEPFHHVYCYGSAAKLKVELSQGDIYQYSIFGKGTDSANIYVLNDTLFCMFRKVQSGTNTIHISAPEYNSITTLLTHGLVSTDTIVTDSLFISTFNDGKIDMQLKADKLVAKLEGKGRVKLSGQCKEAHVQLFHNLKMDALDLWVEDAYIAALSMNKVKLNVSKHLWIDKAFISTIEYYGSPEIMHVQMLHSTIKCPLFMSPSTRPPYMDE